MTARDYLATLRYAVIRMRMMRNKAAAMREACLPSSPSTDGVGCGWSDPNALTKVDRLLEYELKVDAAQAALNARISRACDVIYGRSGRGGIVKLKGSLDADIVYAYYVEAQSWHEIALALAPAESTAPEDWCRMRANRALTAVDAIGIERAAAL